MKTLIGTFSHEIAIDLPQKTINQVYTRMNLHYFNDEDCNKMENGRWVAKYPELETAEVKEAFARIRRTQIRTIWLRIYSDGSFEIIQEKDLKWS